MYSNPRKVTAQRNAAISLIVGALIVMYFFLQKTNFQPHRTMDRLGLAACGVLLCCGLVGLRTSLRKLKKRS